MTATQTSTAATDPPIPDTGMPFRRLLRVHLRIWCAQPAMKVGATVTCGLGLVGAVVAMATIPGTVTSDAVTQRLGYLAEFYVLVWLALGIFAGAAPFRSRWAVMVLALAPRRMWWLGACYASLLAGALAVTAGFALLTGIG